MGASGGVDSQCSNWNRIRRTDLIHHRINHKALETLAMATTPATTAVHQVNLPFSYYHRSKGTSLPQETRYRTPLRETLRSLANWKKHKLCLLSIPLQLHLLQRLSERTTTSLQSLFVQRTTMEPLPHGLLVLFQQAIDRQDSS